MESPSSSSTPSISNPIQPSTPFENKRKKRRKTETTNTTHHHHQTNKWKSATEHHNYSTKLIHALRNRTSAPRAVRDTADRVLAAAAKGRTRWSRAILTNRLKFQMNMIKHKRKNTKGVVKLVTADSRLTKPAVKRSLPVLERKVRVLGRLVPGCSKLSFCKVLEEATDYIAALEMQVRAMAAITGLITGSISDSTRLDSNSL